MANEAAARSGRQGGASAGGQGEALAGGPAEGGGERHPQPGHAAGEAAGRGRCPAQQNPGPQCGSPGPGEAAGGLQQCPRQS